MNLSHGGMPFARFYPCHSFAVRFDNILHAQIVREKKKQNVPRLMPWSEIYFRHFCESFRRITRYRDMFRRYLARYRYKS